MTALIQHSGCVCHSLLLLLLPLMETAGVQPGGSVFLSLCHPSHDGEVQGVAGGKGKLVYIQLPHIKGASDQDELLAEQTCTAQWGFNQKRVCFYETLYPLL